MSDLYSDAMTQTATAAILAQYIGPLDASDHDIAEQDACRVLDAVAPLIAAKALRDAADADWPWPVTSAASPYVMHTWLRSRADEIERGQS